MYLLNALPEISPDKVGGINEDRIQGTGVFEGDMFEKLLSDSDGLLVNFFDIGVKAITIFFIVGVLLMIMAIIFKHGQWQKWAQGTMLFSFIAMLFIRAIPLAVLSFQSSQDIQDAFNALLSGIGHITLFIGVIGIFIGLLFKLFHKLIDHPEYYRWYKNAISISIIMMVLSILAPILFKTI